MTRRDFLGILILVPAVFLDIVTKRFRHAPLLMPATLLGNWERAVQAPSVGEYPVICESGDNEIYCIYRAYNRPGVYYSIYNVQEQTWSKPERFW